MSKIILTPSEARAIAEVGCPHCGQQKTQRCIRPSAVKATIPHRDRVEQFLDIQRLKSKRFFPRGRVRHGELWDGMYLTS